MAKQKGLTLIELMVTMAIIGILAGVAWPFYERQSMKNRRTDVIGQLSQLQAELDRCYYSANAAKGFGEGTYEGCGYLVPATTAQGHYTLNFNVTMDGALMAGKQGVGYTITATPTAGGAQVNDDDCAVFTLTSAGVKTAVDSSAATNNACWGSN